MSWFKNFYDTLYYHPTPRNILRHRVMAIGLVFIGGVMLYGGFHPKSGAPKWAVWFLLACGVFAILIGLTLSLAVHKMSRRRQGLSDLQAARDKVLRVLEAKSAGHQLGPDEWFTVWVDHRRCTYLVGRVGKGRLVGKIGREEDDEVHFAPDRRATVPMKCYYFPAGMVEAIHVTAICDMTKSPELSVDIKLDLTNLSLADLKTMPELLVTSQEELEELAAVLERGTYHSVGAPPE